MPKSRFKDVYIFEDETSRRLLNILVPGYRDILFHEPLLQPWPYIQEQLLPFIKPGSLLVGCGLNGLMAAKIQELNPHLNFSVIAICAPTSHGDIALDTSYETDRVALYSTASPLPWPAEWERFTDLHFDMPVLQHGVGLCGYAMAYLITCQLRGLDMKHEVAHLFPSIAEETSNEPYTV